LSKHLKIIIAGIFFVVVAVATAYLVWQMTTPKKFQLDISNETTWPVNQVTVFGMGAYHAQSAYNIEPGQFASIIVNLKPEGDLRFSVEQGFTSVDYAIAQDVETFEQLKQWLTIEPGNRFIVKDVD
jgi:hypothetical protein